MNKLGKSISTAILVIVDMIIFWIASTVTSEIDMIVLHVYGIFFTMTAFLLIVTLWRDNHAPDNSSNNSKTE